MIEIKNLKVKIEGDLILKGINLTVKAGEIVAIMGKNGSGKSTMAYALSGHPRYEIEGKILMDGKNITKMIPDERANEGLFLASQYPVAVSGLTVNSFLWQLYKKRNPGIKTSIVAFRDWLEEQAKALDLNTELLGRGLNDGFSGGEKKKMEMMQMLVFDPKYLILDEIDSGLDVDALKKIALTVAKVVKERKIGVVAITHYNRILKYLTPDKVVVIDDGKVTKIGNKELAEEIEDSGYGKDSER